MYSWIVIIVVFQDGFDMLSDLWLVVWFYSINKWADEMANKGERTEWNGWEEMMRYVVVADVMKEEASSPAEERPVHGRNGAAEKWPLLVSIMRDGRVRMMKEGKHDYPCIYQELEISNDHEGKHTVICELHKIS